MDHASACAKIILCGEHAVVYTRPAIAVPIHDLRAHATFTPQEGGALHVHLEDLDERWVWSPHLQHPLAVVISHTLDTLGQTPPSGMLQVRSDIPIGGGLGSSAAVATAVVRVLAQALHHPLPPDEVARLVYEGEKLWHGTPSGIDNTVIAYEQPIWFVKGAPPEPFELSHPIPLVIADSGQAAATRDVVAYVRQQWEAQKVRYEALFDAIGRVVHRARDALVRSDWPELGALLNENHYLLEQMGVSSPQLDALVQAAREAGAWGAKLAGAGWGGNVIALAPPSRAGEIVHALRRAGAQHVYTTGVTP